MKILLTGSSGYIGTKILEQYRAAGHTVIPFDLKSDQDLQRISHEKLVELLQDVEVVSHHAAQVDVRYSLNQPYEDLLMNTGSTIKLLAAAKEAGVKRFIFASSAGAIDNEDQPKTPYGISKLTAEKYIKHFDIESVILRYSNVFGAGEGKGVLSIFAENMVANKNISVNGGDQTRDYIYIDDIASVNLEALTCLEDTYVISSGKSLSLKDVTLQMKKLLKTGTQIFYRDHIPGELMISEVTPKYPINWSPKISFADGLDKTILYYLDK